MITPAHAALVTLFLVVLILIIYAIIYSRNSGNVMKEVAARLNTRCNLQGRYVVNRNGKQCWYHYTPGSKNRPPKLTVSVPCLSHGEFTVEREGKLDQMAKKIGLSSELQTGDSDFDNNYYIFSDTVDFARVYFQSPKKREMIKNIFGTGFSQVKHNGKSIEASWPGFALPGFNDSLVMATIDNLAELSENIQDYFAELQFLGIPRLRIKNIILYLFPSLVLVGAVVSLFWVIQYQPLDGFNLFMYSLLFSVPAVIAYLILTGFTIRGRASAHKDFIRIGFLSLMGFVFFANNALVFVNGSKDRSAPAFHNAKVVHKYWTRHKNTTTYHVSVQSWRPGRIREEFTVGAQAFKRIQPGKTEAAIFSKPGALGFERVVSMRYNY